MRTKASNQNRFMRFITIPIRALGKAKDFYVRIITDCAQRVSYGGAMGIQSGLIHNLPKSFSVSFSWMATVGGNVESAAVPTSVLVRVAHELLQAGHRAGHAVRAINVPYMFKVGSEKRKRQDQECRQLRSLIQDLERTEGQGIADVLFGDYGFTGKLARTWFKTVDQLPMNVGDSHYDPLFPFGFGLTTQPVKN